MEETLGTLGVVMGQVLRLGWTSACVSVKLLFQITVTPFGDIRNIPVQMQLGQRWLKHLREVVALPIEFHWLGNCLLSRNLKNMPL